MTDSRYPQSDFGQSCLLSSQQAHGASQTYCGTRGYLAPEMMEINNAASDFIKCDIWALGLLVWETWLDGVRYFDSPEAVGLVKEREMELSRSLSVEGENTDSHHVSSVGTRNDLFIIQDALCPLAMKSIDIQATNHQAGVVPMSRNLVKQVLRLSLQVDPSRRCGDVSRLPFTYSLHM